MATNPVYNNQIVYDYFSNASQRNTGDLGKDDFLNLLVTQLKYQDPLKPMEDKEFIAQMAQFSSLEQMQNMNKTFSSVKAFGMIGKQVLAVTKDEETGELQEVAGVVESVKLANGKPYALVDGKDIPIDDITDVFEAPPSAPPERITDYTNMIGKNVTGIFIDAKSMEQMEIVGDVGELDMINGTVYSTIDNVNATIDDVLLSETEVESFTDMEAYLTQNIDKDITAVLKDTVEVDGKAEEVTVTVKGVLRSFTIGEDGQITAKLDGIKIPANNVVSIR